MASRLEWSLWLVITLHAGIASWCAVWPLVGLLDKLQSLAGWRELYTFSTSNLDVWLVSVLLSVLLLAVTYSAPASQGRDGAPAAANHKMMRRITSIIASLCQCFLLIKAAGIAVGAPADIWPHRTDDYRTSPPIVGLVYLYVPVVVGMVMSMVIAQLAKRVIKQREAAYEEDVYLLRAPLLAAALADGKEPGRAGKEKPKLKQTTIMSLLRLSFPDAPLIMAAFMAGAAAALGSAAVPFYTGQIIDYASIEPDRQRFEHSVAKLLGISALLGVFTGIRGGLFTVAMNRLNVRTRKLLFKALLTFEMGFFDTTKTGEVTSRLSADTTTVSDQISLNLNVILRSTTSAALVLVFMFAAQWRLTVVTFILIPVNLVIAKVYGRYYRMLAKKVQAALAEANSVAEEVLSSMSTVKAHAAEASAEAAYANKLSEFVRLQRQEAAAYTLYMSINTFLPNAVSAAVLFYGGNLVLDGRMSPGALVSFMFYQSSLSGSFQMITECFSSLTAAVGAADKVIELMERKPKMPASGSRIPGTFKGQIELEAVIFSYPARPDVRVLDSLSLVVHPGEVVALVGPSGGGKSSIVKLVERFYGPTSGRVLIDGWDVGDYDAKWLRRQVAFVSQEPVLYGRSVKRNIMYGLEPEDGAGTPPTDEEVQEAAKQANAHEFIMAFPEGYETNCGEKGVAISGGQKQRIAIARALIRQPKVLLLDEATSALDADSEAVVQEALDRMMQQRTTLVIAHRLSTIQSADRIFVIGKGVVQEVGTHDSLLEKGGVYASLVRRQLTKSVSTAQLSRPSSLISIASHGGGGMTPSPSHGGGGGGLAGG